MSLHNIHVINEKLSLQFFYSRKKYETDFYFFQTDDLSSFIPNTASQSSVVIYEKKISFLKIERVFSFSFHFLFLFFALRDVLSKKSTIPSVSILIWMIQYYSFYDMWHFNFSSNCWISSIGIDDRNFSNFSQVLRESKEKLSDFDSTKIHLEWHQITL